MVSDIYRVDRKRKSTKEDHLEKKYIAKKPKAVTGVGRPLAERITS
jgi:hypothetical protein